MKLADYLTEHGISQTDFARAAGVSISTVSRIARGLHRPDWPAIDAIRAATRGAVGPEDYEAPEQERAAS